MRVFILLGCIMALGGCKTSVQDGPRKVVVQDGYYHDGDFCPPGQAKKGNC